MWFFSFWHITFPLAVIAYVLLKNVSESASRPVKLQPPRVIAITIACVLAAIAALTWAVAAEYLPSLYTEPGRQTAVLHRLIGAMSLLNAIALVALLFIRRGTILDVWLSPVSRSRSNAWDRERKPDQRCNFLSCLRDAELNRTSLLHGGPGHFSTSTMRRNGEV